MMGEGAGVTVLVERLRKWFSPKRVARNVKPPILRNELRKCRACGAIYHFSWGNMCANCSGAD